MNNTVTKQVDRTDREQYLEACRSYAAATSPMDGLALAQLAIAAIFAGMQIGEHGKNQPERDAGGSSSFRQRTAERLLRSISGVCEAACR